MRSEVEQAEEEEEDEEMDDDGEDYGEDDVFNFARPVMVKRRRR